MFLIPLVSDPRVLAANGQVLLVRRARLDQIGGVAAIKGEVVDDMALCRAVKKGGGRVIFADGRDIASCRMYQSRAEVERGFSKNLYEGIGGSLPALFVVIALHLLFFVLPYLGLLLSPLVPGLLLPSLDGPELYWERSHGEP